MLVWGGPFGIIYPPQVPLVSVRIVPSPFLGRLVEIWAGCWYHIGPFALQVTVRRPRHQMIWPSYMVALQSHTWNLTSWFCIPSPLSHPCNLGCSPGHGLSKMLWGYLVTPFPVRDISEFCLGVKLIMYLSYSAHWMLTCFRCLGHILYSYIFFIEKINSWKKAVIWST